MLFRSDMRSEAWEGELEAQADERGRLERGPRVLDQKWVQRTRSEHTCTGCGGEIAAGDACRTSTITSAEGIETLRECETCANATPGAREHVACENRGEYRREY